MEKNNKADALIQRANAEFTTLTGQILPLVTKLIQIGSCPWYCRLPQIDWTIKNQLWAGCNSVIANRHFAELVQQKYHKHHLIFTDGSIQNGSSGCGIYSSIDNSAIRLPDDTIISTAEAIALVIAADVGLHRDKLNVIFTDSASVLQALESGTTRDPNIQQLLCNIPNSPQVTFCWIPSHTGIQGNEIANRLINAGRNNPAWCHNTHPRRDFIRHS